MRVLFYLAVFFFFLCNTLVSHFEGVASWFVWYKSLQSSCINLEWTVDTMSFRKTVELKIASCHFGCLWRLIRLDSVVF